VSLKSQQTISGAFLPLNQPLLYLFMDVGPPPDGPGNMPWNPMLCYNSGSEDGTSALRVRNTAAGTECRPSAVSEVALNHVYGYGPMSLEVLRLVANTTFSLQIRAYHETPIKAGVFHVRYDHSVVEWTGVYHSRESITLGGTAVNGGYLPPPFDKDINIIVAATDLTTMNVTMGYTLLVSFEFRVRTGGANAFQVGVSELLDRFYQEIPGLNVQIDSDILWQPCFGCSIVV
tara:strand:- start:2 stop:697 length:696 start_codon:yes stop_codon:yes gene_type:complete